MLPSALYTVNALQTLNTVTLTMASVMGIRHNKVTVYPRYIDDTTIQIHGTDICGTYTYICSALTSAYITATATLQCKKAQQKPYLSEGVHYDGMLNAMRDDSNSKLMATRFGDRSFYHRCGMTLTSMCRELGRNELMDSRLYRYEMKPEYLYHREGLLRSNVKHYISNPNNLLEENNILDRMDIKTKLYIKGNM